MAVVLTAVDCECLCTYHSAVLITG